MEGPRRLKIGITGASGFVGRRVIQEISRLGHFAIAFSRNPANAVPGCMETRYFGPPRESSGRPESSTSSSRRTGRGAESRMNMKGLDAVVHLAGESLFGVWTAAKKQRVLQSRRDGTRWVVDAIKEASENGQNGPKVLVSASAIGFYGDTGDREVDESAPSGEGFLAEVTRQWESEVLRAEQAGVRVAILRIGLVLGKEGGAMSVLRPLFKMGLGARLGSGQQWVSWIHVSDLARLILYSIENEHVRGPLNATAPTPVRNIDFTEALARKFDRRALFVAPERVMRWVIGDFAQALFGSQRVLPRRTETVGYHCQYKKL